MFLFNEQNCADICLKNTNKYVFKAVNDLINDFSRVSEFGVKPAIVKTETHNCIVIEENTRTSAEPVADESYSLSTENGNLIIRADGYLGTMWGIYTLSEKFLGVDPCYLFNDLAIVKKRAVEIPELHIADKPEGFGFRGVFINDEDLLQGWKDGGGARLVGGGYYYVTVAKSVIEKVVETVLRLKLNLVIPATFVDLDNPPEKDLADAVAERGIYLSQHHCEPLGVSSFTFENHCRKYGKTGRFSYSECPEIMENVWSFYVDKWAKYDNVVWQIGLRGLGDDRPIWQDDVPTEKILEKSGEFISKAYRKEKDIILAATGGKACHFTSTLWMEGSALVEKGYLKFPKDVIMVFADTAPTQLYGDEYDLVPREKGGKYGIYYHLQYYGCGPHLVPQTGLKKLYYNMKKAYDKGDTDYFIMNVSNVREFVFEMKAYAESAWNMNKYSPDAYLQRYCENFGEYADEIKTAIVDFYQSFPELDSKYLEKHLSTYFNYTKTPPPAGITEFVLKEGSIIDYGKRITDNFDKDLSKWLCHEYAFAIKPVIANSNSLCARFEQIIEKLDEPLKTHFKIKWLLSAKTLNYIYKWYVALHDAKIYRDEYDGENMKKSIIEASGYLFDYLNYRKCAEYGEFANWYRGDLKMNIKQRLYDTLKIIGQTPEMVKF